MGRWTPRGTAAAGRRRRGAHETPPRRAAFRAGAARGVNEARAARRRRCDGAGRHGSLDFVVIPMTASAAGGATALAVMARLTAALDAHGRTALNDDHRAALLQKRGTPRSAGSGTRLTRRRTRRRMQPPSARLSPYRSLAHWRAPGERPLRHCAAASLTPPCARPESVPSMARAEPSMTDDERPRLATAALERHGAHVRSFPVQRPWRSARG